LKLSEISPDSSVDGFTSEKLADVGNSATFYPVLVEVGLAKPKSTAGEKPA
jgi:hypothetical protein